MVTTSGFTHTPLTLSLILLQTSASILTSTLSSQHLLPIKPTPHLWPYLQFSRLLTYQFAYTSSVEVLTSTIILYHLRVLERLWGNRKFGGFIAVAYILGVGVTPAILLLLKGLSLGWYNYLPSGGTTVVFALLAAWREEVPGLFRWKILTESPSSGTDATRAKGVVLSDKITTYFLAAQLALSQFPYNILPALVGWAVGTAYMGELLPRGLTRWRIPAWVVGEASQRKERGQYEGLRRRLEEEGGAADGMRTVSERVVNEEGVRNERRGFGRLIGGYFTGS
jgi:membrane associated rhomboid family serine protease